MGRIDLFDGFRGYFLVGMLLSHLFEGGMLLAKVSHGELSYVQNAQGFVFLSGLLVGLVYAGNMDRRGYAPAATRIYRRAWELYLYTTGTVLAITLIGKFLRHSSTYWHPWLWQLADNDPHFLLSAIVLLFQPTYMDILPQYIIYLALSPPLVWLCLTGRWRPVLIGSVVLWTAAQVGMHRPLEGAVHELLASLYSADLFRAHFNVLAWQIVFVSGLILGVATATRTIDWASVLDPRDKTLARAALALVLFFMAWRVGFTLNVVPAALAERFSAYDLRGDFSVVYLVNFAALAYLVAWVMVAGPRAGNRLLGTLANGLHWLFGLPFLRLLGRHSLQVYCWHVLIVYLVRAAEWRVGPFRQLTMTVIAITAVALLAVPAFYLERRGAAHPAPAAG